MSLSDRDRALIERADPMLLNWITEGGRAELAIQRLLEAARQEGSTPAEPLNPSETNHG